MKKTRRFGQSPKPARARTSNKGAAAPREPWSERLSWGAVRLRAAAVHAFAGLRERVTRRASTLGRRAVSARSRLTWRFRRGKDSTSGVLWLVLASVGVAGLVFLVFGGPSGALAAGGWTFAIALLLALRSAQQRHAVAVQRELYELREQLRVANRNGLAVRRELYELAQQLRNTEPPVQDGEFEAAEEIDLSDEPTRAVPVPKRPALGWRKRFGLHWPASR
jgi:hypothetical protein